MPQPGSRARLCRGCGIAAWSLLPLGALIIIAGLLLPGFVQRQLEEGVTCVERHRRHAYKDLLGLTLLVHQIRRNIIWAPDSPPEVDARFRSNIGPGSPPDLFRAWMFNITNLEAVRLQGARPMLAEVGPLTYTLARERLDVLWDGTGRVQFKEFKHFTFEPALSAVSPDAAITTWNLPLLGVLAVLHAHADPRLLPFADLIASVMESYEASGGSPGLFTVRTAHELLFGYEDPLLATLARLLPAGMLPSPRVALLPNMTGPEEARAQGPIIFNTGAREPDNIWQIEADKGVSAVTSWACGPERVRGSDASLFRPGLTTSSRLRVWVGEIFRSAEVVVSEVVEMAGLRLLRFKVEPSQLEPDPCYYSSLHGLFNVTSPVAAGPTGKPNTPGPQLLLSLPHFCEADARLSAAVDGLSCDPDKHSLYVDVEPITGATLRAYKRLQLSSRVGHLGQTLEPRIAANLTIPIFWAEESSQALPQQLKAFKGSIYTACWLIDNLLKWCSFVGGACVTIGIIALVLAVDQATLQQRLASEEAVPPSSLAAANTPRGQRQARIKHQGGNGTGAADATREPLLPSVDMSGNADAVDVGPALDQTQPAGPASANNDAAERV